MYEDLIKSNISLVEDNSKLKSNNKKLESKNRILLEFAKGVSFNSPLQFDKLKEELRRIDNEREDGLEGREGSVREGQTEG
jgi:hypothetical protein